MKAAALIAVFWLAAATAEADDRRWQPDAVFSQVGAGDATDAWSVGGQWYWRRGWLVRDEVHVLNLATHPDARRQGHAARLLEHVIAFGHKHHCRYLTLEVRRSNKAAIRLYRKYGFRPVGIRPNYYSHGREDAIVMLLELIAPTL